MLSEQRHNLQLWEESDWLFKVINHLEQLYYTCVF